MQDLFVAIREDTWSLSVSSAERYLRGGLTLRRGEKRKPIPRPLFLRNPANNSRHHEAPF